MNNLQPGYFFSAPMVGLFDVVFSCSSRTKEMVETVGIKNPSKPLEYWKLISLTFTYAFIILN